MATIQGVQLTQSLVKSPVQWQLLLALANGPQHTATLRRQLPVKWRWRCRLSLWQLYHRQLIMFHVKQRSWTLTPTGQTLQPILSAIQTCTQNQKGGN